MDVKMNGYTEFDAKFKAMHIMGAKLLAAIKKKEEVVVEPESVQPEAKKQIERIQYNGWKSIVPKEIVGTAIIKLGKSKKNCTKFDTSSVWIEKGEQEEEKKE